MVPPTSTAKVLPWSASPILITPSSALPAAPHPTKENAIIAVAMTVTIVAIPIEYHPCLRTAFSLTAVVPLINTVPLRPVVLRRRCDASSCHPWALEALSFRREQGGGGFRRISVGRSFG